MELCRKSWESTEIYQTILNPGSHADDKETTTAATCRQAKRKNWHFYNLTTIRRQLAEKVGGKSWHSLVDGMLLSIFPEIR